MFTQCTRIPALFKLANTGTNTCMYTHTHTLTHTHHYQQNCSMQSATKVQVHYQCITHLDRHLITKGTPPFFRMWSLFRLSKHNTTNKCHLIKWLHGAIYINGYTCPKLTRFKNKLPHINLSLIFFNFKTCPKQWICHSQKVCMAKYSPLCA